MQRKLLDLIFSLTPATSRGSYYVEIVLRAKMLRPTLSWPEIIRNAAVEHSFSENYIMEHLTETIDWVHSWSNPDRPAYTTPTVEKYLGGLYDYLVGDEPPRIKILRRGCQVRTRTQYVVFVCQKCRCEFEVIPKYCNLVTDYGLTEEGSRWKHNCPYCNLVCQE